MNAGKQTRLIVARHGNTFAPGDVITRVGGRTDLPLVQSGLEQGRKLGLCLKEKGLVPDLVVTSSLKRAVQTAEEARLAAGADWESRVSSDFNEIDYGPDENKPEDQVVARLGAAALKAWDEEAIVPEGWQVEVGALIDGWLRFGASLLREAEGKTVMVVTSNGVARFAPYLTGDFEGFRRRFKIKLSTGAFGLFLFEQGGWVAESWNVRPDK